MKRIVMFLSLVLMLFACENPLEDRVEELEYQLALYEQQQTVNDSLINVLFDQQALIDSLLAQQTMYIDSLNSELFAQIETLTEQQQEIVDMLIGAQDVTGTGEDYVRVSNVQICWGSGKTNLNGSIVNFPVSFTEIPVVIMTPITDGQLIPGVEDISLSTATFYLNIGELTSYDYQAVGYWL